MALKAVLSAAAALICVLALHCNQADAGRSFIRWGRTTCGPYAKLIYKGYVAGTWYNDPGGASNPLCLPEHPTFANTVDGDQVYTAFLFPTEYELLQPAYDNLFSTKNNKGKHLTDYDAVCSVCYVPTSTDILMIPARDDCGEDNNDYNLLYKGYLVANYKGHARTEHVCLDEAPEGKPGSEANNNGNTFYPVQIPGDCKWLPCPEYESNHEVTCAVCSN